MSADRLSFLRSMPLFADLPEPDLRQICAEIAEVRLAAGEVLFTEGSVGNRVYVILEGMIEIYKLSNGQQVQLSILQPGEVIGEVSFFEASPRTASVRAMVESKLMEITHSQFDHLLRASQSAARALLHKAIFRLQSTEVMLGESKKMAQLGLFSAGIAHELNNPAAAVRRGSDQLRTTLESARNLIPQLFSLGITMDFLQSVQLPDHTDTRPALDPLERSDREAEIEEWLERHAVDNAWECSPDLARLGYQAATLDALAGQVPAPALPVLIRWMAAESRVRALLNEVNEGAARISEIVKALKNYIYLDQDPTREIDLHEGIENSLVILRHKLKQGIEIWREYSQDLPAVQANGSELNQVWTNLIDNAIDAAGDQGRITLRTRREGAWVVVEVEDNGPGIPPENQSMLFSPFFTTKPIGQGTGLGLNISLNLVQRQGGEIKVYSQPGQTRFEVWLPVHP